MNTEEQAEFGTYVNVGRYATTVNFAERALLLGVKAVIAMFAGTASGCCVSPDAEEQGVTYLATFANLTALHTLMPDYFVKKVYQARYSAGNEADSAWRTEYDLDARTPAYGDDSSG